MVLDGGPYMLHGLRSAPAAGQLLDHGGRCRPRPQQWFVVFILRGGTAVL